ncbi:GNAT family N-acetyltransferase [Streptomyces sp. NPDC059568]|uniref:GNAT family N-acetyltransferase n=1 Tax=Streptomyces sp. NPDC059568 TaxID=3346868 RepID=UPI003679AEC1
MSTFESPPRGVLGLGRPARPDTDELAALLAAAFHDDPLTRWIIPDDRTRAELLPGLFRIFVDVSHDYDGVALSPCGDAVMLFLPPGASKEVDARGDELEQRFADALGEYAGALGTIVGLQAERHPAGPPHYYASFGAVRPARQRNGLLSVLLQELIDRADREGHPAYAEASSPGGEALCLRQGFVPLGGDITLPNGGPSLRPLWRDPR